MGTGRTFRTVSISVVGVGFLLVAVGLGAPPRSAGRVAVSDDQRVSASVATWVGFDAGPAGAMSPTAPTVPAGGDRLLRAGDIHGGAVTYLKFEVPEVLGMPQARLVLTGAGQPLPILVELVAVPDASWDPDTLSWATAPVLGHVLQSVRPVGDTVTFTVAEVLRGPGTYAFAVTVPPDRGHATFAGSGSEGEPVLMLPTATPPSASPPPATTLPASAWPTAPPPVYEAFPPTTVPTAPAPTMSACPAPTPQSTSLPPGYLPPVYVTPAPATPPPCTALPDEKPVCAVGELLIPTCGVLWGVAPGAHTPVPRTIALAEFEAATGRRQNIYHAYHRGWELFPTPEEVAIAAEGRLLFLNWKPLHWSWAAVAAGAADSYLDRLAEHIGTTFPGPFFFTVHHEPENDVRQWAGSGWTAADYAAMYRHVVERLRSHGLDNLVTVMAYMAYEPWNARPWFPELYPGDDVVDWIGWDTYAYSNPGYGYGDFAEMMNRRSSRYPHWPGFYNWATAQFPDKPFMLAEWGVWHSRRNPGHMAHFYDSVARQTPLLPRMKALVYFDTPADQRALDSRVTATENGLAAYQRLGAYPYFQVALPPQPAATSDRPVAPNGRERTARPRRSGSLVGDLRGERAGGQPYS